MRSFVARPLAVISLCAGAASAHASIAYLNLPTPAVGDPGEASNVEIADDLILDLSGGSTLQSANIRILGASGLNTLAVVRLTLYTDNSGQPGTALTTVDVTIPQHGPAAYDQLFDFPDVTVASNTIWAGYYFTVMPTNTPFIGTGTLPTIGSTTARGANRIGPNSWNVNGANGPPPNGYYLGDRLQISITSVPGPGAPIAFLTALACVQRRRRP